MLKKHCTLCCYKVKIISLTPQYPSTVASLHSAFLTFQAYFNYEALNLIRTLLTGGATPELESMLAEGVGLVRGQFNPEQLSTRHRCRVALLPLEDGLLSPYCVRNNHILCTN